MTNGGITNNSALNGTTDYLYNGQQCIEERNGSNAVIRQFVWGQYIDELVVMKTSVTLGGGSLAAGTYYPLSDLLYRSFALTDNSANVVEAYDTDAYGNTIAYKTAGGGNWFADNAVTTDNPACQYIFTGRQYDPETQIYFYRARYYHPRLGRFGSRDPVFDAPNVYGFVQSNPLRFLDPSGLKCQDECPDLRCPVISAGFLVSPKEFKGVPDITGFDPESPKDWIEKALEAFKAAGSKAQSVGEAAGKYLGAIEGLTNFQLYVYIFYRACEEGPRTPECCRKLGKWESESTECPSAGKALANGTGGFALINGANLGSRLATTVVQCMNDQGPKLARQLYNDSRFKNCPSKPR